MGIQAAGKTSFVKSFVDRGYHRMNRDTEGGNMESLHLRTHELIKKGKEKIVLDNTYPTVESRKLINEIARTESIPISCHLMDTSVDDALFNASLRMVRKYGKLLSPEEMKALKKKDPNSFPPGVIFNYRKIFQEPTTAEGFDYVKKIPFVRQWPAEYKNRAVIFDYDGTLRTSSGNEHYPANIKEIQIHPGMAGVINDFKEGGYILLGASNQSGIGKGVVAEDVVVECFKETNRQLHATLDFMYCPHTIPPVSCYCRKPGVGMGAYFIEKYKLNPAECIMIGDQTSDETFANRCGFKFVNVNSL